MSLADAILFQDAATVKRYLDHGEEIDGVDEYGFTPIIEAAIGNRTDIAELLLKHGANVKSTDLAGRTALHWAAENNNLAFCRLLLQHGADPNAQDKQNQSPLVSPLLRGHNPIRYLLTGHGASLSFAQDYINGKLIGHRFELRGHGYLHTPNGKFALIDFEGFYLEFAIDVIHDSLARFKKNYAARRLTEYFPHLNKILRALEDAEELIKYQQYTTDLRQHEPRIDTLVANKLLIIPTVYQGHAITFVRVGDLLAKCDRGENALKEGAINIFQMRYPERLDNALIKGLIYEIQDDDYIHRGIKETLGLEKLLQLPIGRQVSGNCSWANTESAIPTMLFLLLYTPGGSEHHRDDMIIKAVDFYHAWHTWDQDRALEACLKSFQEDDVTRNSAKATILASVLFQTCRYKNDNDIERAERIMSVLSNNQYRKYVESYLKVYYEDKWTAAGENLTHLFDIIVND